VLIVCVILVMHYIQVRGCVCSYYCGENSVPVQSIQAQHRHQIQVPSSSSTPSIAGHHQHPSPSKSDIGVSGHSQDCDNDTSPVATSAMNDRLELVEYEEEARTWPRKHAGHHCHQQGVDNSNDPATLAANQQDIHNDSVRLALPHDCRSAETAITGDLTDEMQHYDSDASSSASTLAVQILGANLAVPSASQYSTDTPQTSSSYSVQQQFNTTVYRFHDAPVPSTYSYSGSLQSPYDDIQDHRSPAAGIRATADDGRHAVDMLFDSLFQSPQQNQSDMMSAGAVRTFPVSPYRPTHSPYVQSYDHCSQAADLSNVVSVSDTDSPFHSTPSASDIHSYHR